jgi:glycosyltransferase involved in cell wall biosynthesis
LVQEYNDVSLTIVGNGDFTEYSSEYKSLPNVDVINRWIDDKEVGYFFEGRNVITVLPYLDATQSGVVPIAMEYGSAIIASNTGGLEEQIQDGITGLLFKVGDSDSLYTEMKLICENNSLRETIIKNASDYLLQLDWNVLSKKLADYIERFE